MPNDRGFGFPRGVPESFLDTYVEWSEERSRINCAEEVFAAAKLLSIEELMSIFGKTHPGFHFELYWIAVAELANRDLTPEQCKAAREAWEHVRLAATQSPHSFWFNLKQTERMRALVGKLS